MPPIKGSILFLYSPNLSLSHEFYHNDLQLQTHDYIQGIVIVIVIVIMIVIIFQSICYYNTSLLLPLSSLSLSLSLYKSTGDKENPKVMFYKLPGHSDSDSDSDTGCTNTLGIVREGTSALNNNNNNNNNSDSDTTTTTTTANAPRSMVGLRNQGDSIMLCLLTNNVNEVYQRIMMGGHYR